MRIYVASSWRNQRQRAVVEYLGALGHEAYDFKNAGPGKRGFGWSEIDPDWQNWSVSQFTDALLNPIAEAGFQTDLHALYGSQACVLVLPCGRSAHLEAGFAVGHEKPLFILTDPTAKLEPELMYRWAQWIGPNLGTLGEIIHDYQRTRCEMQQEHPRRY